MTWFLDDNLFRTTAVIGFLATVAAIVLHFVASRPGIDDASGRDQPLRIFAGHRCGFIGVLRKVVFLLALLCFIVLVVTGFVPMIFLGDSMQGWWLMVHVTAAPVFAACMAVLAVLWADRNRLDKNYWPRLNSVLHRQPASTAVPGKYELKLKICFWLILFLSLPVILSAVLAMFSLFGTDGQELLLQLHRYSALLLSLFAIAYLYLAARSSEL